MKISVVHVDQTHTLSQRAKNKSQKGKMGVKKFTFRIVNETQEIDYEKLDEFLQVYSSIAKEQMGLARKENEEEGNALD